MKLNVVKWGNSTALRLPATLLAQLGAQMGDAFDAEVVKDKLVLRVAKPQEVPDRNAAIEAMKFALDPRTVEGMEFLRCWMQGQFDAIRKEWPGAPAAVFIGADPALEVNSRLPEAGVSEPAAKLPTRRKAAS